MLTPRNMVVASRAKFGMAFVAGEKTRDQKFPRPSPEEESTTTPDLRSLTYVYVSGAF